MIYKTTPWSHQKKDVDRIHAEHIKNFALFYDMGAGKTKTAIDICRSIYIRHDRILKTLIICPIAVVENWKREFAVHSSVPPTAIQVVDGKTKLNGKKVKNAQAKIRLSQVKESDSQIFVINTEGAKYQPTESDVWYWVERLGIELLVVDESHRFKSHDAKRTKALHKLCGQEQLQYRYILTGSPVLQDALDLWAQFYILDPKILGYNYFEFRARYFYDANAGMPSNVHFPNFVPKDEKYYEKMGIPYNDDTADLNKLIYQHASRVMKDEVLDLPPYINEKVPVEMGKDQARIYKEMRDDLVASLEEAPNEMTVTSIGMQTELADLLDDDAEVMVADLAIVKTLRLMQITAGIFTNDKGEITVLKTALATMLEEMLESVLSNKENKAIIWTIFKPTYQIIADICDKLGVKYTFLTGAQDKDQKQANIDQFNEDPETQVIIANQGAGGTGCNLTSANYDFYYSWDFSLEKYLQSQARGYRGGQTRKYTSYKLTTKDTIAERSLEALEAKSANAEDILKVRTLERDDILSLI